MPEEGYQAVLFDCLPCWFVFGANHVQSQMSKKEFRELHQAAQDFLDACKTPYKPGPPQLCLQEAGLTGALDRLKSRGRRV